MKKSALYILLIVIGYWLSSYEINMYYALILVFLIQSKKMIKSLIRKLSGNDLFEGDCSLFKKHLNDCKVYGEYGMGQSTLWVFQNTDSEILAVDTSQDWVNKVKSKINSDPRVKINWVDLGKIGRWGRPKSYVKRKFIYDYLDFLWKDDIKPEIVLVDGRFRVACFLYSLLKGKPGTKIFFDDYTNRPYYHVVEEYLKPIETSGRQALFLIPEGLDYNKIKLTMEHFVHVMD